MTSFTTALDSPFSIIEDTVENSALSSGFWQSKETSLQFLFSMFDQWRGSDKPLPLFMASFSLAAFEILFEIITNFHDPLQQTFHPNITFLS